MSFNSKMSSEMLYIQGNKSKNLFFGITFGVVPRKAIFTEKLFTFGAIVRCFCISNFSVSFLLVTTHYTTLSVRVFAFWKMFALQPCCIDIWTSPRCSVNVTFSLSESVVVDNGGDGVFRRGGTMVGDSQQGNSISASST